MEMTSYAKARSNLCTLNDATTEKQSLDLHSSLKKHRGQTHLVPRLHITIYQVK
jgi:hypothetical protein